jgi:dolichyl-diphosphooligosaccharide--protein glycosyltransferase
MVVTDDRTEVYMEATQFCESRTGGKAILETVLAVDDAESMWTFDDVELDSGTFGEIVDRGFVEKVDGEYRVTDREAVRAALEGEALKEIDKSDSGSRLELEINWPALAGLVVAVAVIALARTFHYKSVLVQGRVISPGNDPYFFRYWQDRLIEESSGPWDFGVLVNPPWDDGSFNQRPLTHATNWWVTELLGGDQWAADLVVAFLPLVFTILLAVVIYYLALLLTRDYRVGVASVVTLALAPIHAVYTGIGLLHHRYNQYLWFGLLLVTLGWLGVDIVRRRDRVGTATAISEHLRDRKTWLVALGFALAFAAWTHSWGGSLELFVGLGAFVALRVCMDLRDGVSPGLVNLPLVLGFGVGSALAMALHLTLGWHGLPAPAMAVVTFLRVVGVVGLGEVWSRQGWSARSLLLVQPIVALGGLVGALLVVGEMGAVVDTVLGSIGVNAGPDQVSSQSTSLYSAEAGFFLRPVVQIGIVFYIGLAMLVWCIKYVYRGYNPAWLLLCVITSHYLIVSGIQMRFAGRLVIVMSVFCGSGIVYLLSIVDLAREPVLFGENDSKWGQGNQGVQNKLTESAFNIRRGGLILFMILLVFSANLIFLPTHMEDATHDRTHVVAAMEISGHAHSLDREYPENHVFAPWGKYRMYNYFVSGEAESESIGRYHYPKIYSWANPSAPFKYTDNRPTGYIVVTESPVPTTENSIYQNLFIKERSVIDDHTSGQYRLIHISNNGNLFVYAIVPGAEVLILGNQEQSISIEKEIAVSNNSYTYNRTVPLGADGRAILRIPYSGQYQVGGSVVNVTDTQIETGGRVRVNLRDQPTASSGHNK